MNIEELERLSERFLKNPIEDNALNLLRFLRNSNMLNICIFLGEHFSSIFPHCLEINDEVAIASYYKNDHDRAYDTLEKSLMFKNLSEDKAWKILFNQHFSINQVSDRYIYYNSEKIQLIVDKNKSEIPLVTFTITTCKRFDLFEKTINSVINCLDTDKIDIWFCVDDNSSDEDREKMKKLYPFFIFYFKKKEEKGHPQSMNIIRNFVKTPYMLHMEDDWKFIVKRNYIRDAFDVLSSDRKIGQCLFNKNYTEIESDVDVKGGIFKTTDSGTRYYIHEYVNSDEDKQKWFSKYGSAGYKTSNYWPHFSFRPSLLRTSILKELGEFDIKISHFEMDYAYRYVNRNYVSAFFEGIYCLHIGRLTSEKDDETKLNAYKLNDEIQFYGKENAIDNKLDLDDENKNNISVKTYVVNLDSRKDRWQKFIKNSTQIDFLNYERFSAVDGKQIKSSCQLQQIFENNDYNMRRGMVGCTLSHVKMYIELIYSSNYDALFILEDDVEVTPDFKKKYFTVMNKLINTNWDIVMIGHHIRDIIRQEDDISTSKIPSISKSDVYWSFTNSLGGTFAYLISKKGAEKLLDFINIKGAQNGIDTLIQKSCNDLNVYYCSPTLVFSECFRGDSKIDSDIQYNYDNSLVKTAEQRLNDELSYYKIIRLIDNFEEALLSVSGNDNFYFKNNGNDSNIDNIIIECKKHDSYYYTIEYSIIFVIPKVNINNVTRYFHRFKKNDKYNIDDCL